jgi:hypothetical protein
MRTQRNTGVLAQKFYIINTDSLALYAHLEHSSSAQFLQFLRILFESLTISGRFSVIITARMSAMRAFIVLATSSGSAGGMM